MRHGAPATVATLLVTATALGLGCPEEPTDKVERWAASVLPDASPAAEGSARPPELTLAPVQHLPAEPPCVRLVREGCERMGAHSEECLRARRLLPVERRPEWRRGCAQALDRHADLLTEAVESRGPNACRRLEQLRCKRSGAGSPSCRQAREDAARLRRKGNEALCLGDLLLEEARSVLGRTVSGVGR